MSQNKDDATKNTGTTDASTSGSSSTQGMTKTPATSTTGTSSATATAQDLASRAKEQAQNYGQKASDAAVQAKDYVSDKMSAVGDKLKDLQNTDVRQVAEDAKQYARQNPGQALMISAAAGFLLGILLRGGKRR